uniref:Cyclic nucleotide gated channel subunit beta 1 n=1 Tax=Cavia porcellus TaxID=10141 RepID=A0A286XM35_CAVPO
MLGWVQKVLPQPPGTPQKSKIQEEEEAEAEPELVLEPDPEAAPEEAEPEGDSLSPEELANGEQVAAADPSLQGECWKPWQSLMAGQLGAEGRWLFCLCPGSSSSWVLTWLRKSVEKVVPQPVCSDRNGQNTATDTGFPAQDGPQVVGPCSTGDTGKATKSGPWLLRWLEQNLEKVLPQPPKLSEVSVEREGVLWGDPKGLSPHSHTELMESPSLPSPGFLEAEMEPVAEPQPNVQVPFLPPPGDPARLMAWLLHRLEMALPQPVLNGKAGNQEPDSPETCDVQTSK